MEASRAATGIFEVLAMRHVRFMMGSLRPSKSMVSYVDVISFGQILLDLS
jgi:hypothetical protein